MLPKSIGQIANDEATFLASEYVGTEHLLLALAAPTGTVTACVLSAQGIDRDRLRSAVTRIVQFAPCESWGMRPWTPRAHKAVQFAVDEARALGHNYVGPEHVLLGVLRVVDGVGVQALRELGVEPSTLRRAVLEGLEQV